MSGATGFRSGIKTVTTAGTRVQMADASTVPGIEIKTVAIQALSTNTGVVTVGDSNVVAAVGSQGTPTQRGIRLAAGQLLTVDLDDITTLWLDCATNGDGVSWLAGVA